MAVEARFKRTADGCIWTEGAFQSGFWRRYLGVFDQVLALGRVEAVESAPPAWQPVREPGLSFASLPYYVGPLAFARCRQRLVRTLCSAIHREDAIILRVPGNIGNLVHGLARARRHPYGVEVVGNPEDVFAPGAVHHPLRAFFRYWFAANLRRQCRTACAAAYVTERTLQRSYPPGAGAFATSFSTIDLHAGAFVPESRVYGPAQPGTRLLFVGSLEQMYKGAHILLEALYLCARRGQRWSLVVLGDGRCRPHLEALVQEFGLDERVSFLGQVPAGDAVRRHFDEADLYVHPSLTEGLPRALIEAMARGLPCVGSRVGGIPELLSEPDLVRAGDAIELAEKLVLVMNDPARLTAMSARNLAQAAHYRQEVLSERRAAFYREVKGRTQTWLQRQGREG